MKKATLIARAILAPTLVAFAWMYYPFCEDGPILCLWKSLFHFQCLGCGLTRAMCFLVHGRYVDAIEMNWLIVPVMVTLIAISCQATSTLLAECGKRLHLWPIKNKKENEHGTDRGCSR